MRWTSHFLDPQMMVKSHKSRSPKYLRRSVSRLHEGNMVK
jgi:hypothetical protein